MKHKSLGGGWGGGGGAVLYLFMVLYNQLIILPVLAPDPGNEQSEL